MIAMIGELLARGHAYTAEGDVLFEVASDPGYGVLSRRNTDEMLAGARVEVAPYKKSPFDFVLWKPSLADEPGWDSPWGRGRPGWHIECSAMSRRYLGQTFDIHGGGQDLIFPHHENEIAQSTCAHGGQPFVRYWLHNGFLMAEGQKMSKSLGNFYTVHELLAEFTGEAIRLSLLQTHYRQPLDFTRAGIQQSRQALNRVYTALRDLAAVPDAEPAAPQAVLDALSDDLNTPEALAHVFGLVAAAHKAPPAEQAAIKAQLLGAGALLGLFAQDPDAWFRWQPEGAETVSEQAIAALIEERREARKARDFARADRIRAELADAGILLEDNAAGTTWRRA
jgi:cysteinyl-tRNA synthetase